MSFGASTGLGYPRCTAWISACRTFSLVVSYGGNSAWTAGQEGVSGAGPLSWSPDGFAGEKSDFNSAARSFSSGDGVRSFAPSPGEGPGRGLVAPDHEPFVTPEAEIPEFTAGPVLVGARLGIPFGASSVSLVLKVGGTVRASIPWPSSRSASSGAGWARRGDRSFHFAS
jgi:hypothetical protein